MVPKPREFTDKELKLEISRLQGENCALQSHADALKTKLNRQKHEADQSRLEREQRDIDEHLELVKLRSALVQAAMEPSASSMRTGIKEQLPILQAMAAKRVQPASRSPSPVNRVQKRKRASSVRDDSSSDDEEQVAKIRHSYKRHSSPQVQIKPTTPAKRGRPSQSTPVKHPSSPTKYRGRGRPRKSDRDPADDSSDDEDAPPSLSKRGRGRPRTSDNKAQDSETNSEIEPPRRKPGRPKKISMNGGKPQQGEDEAEHASPRKRGPGRPKKQRDISPGSDEEVKPAAPRKFGPRGPRKQPMEDGSSHSSDEETVLPPKRGRGRPKLSNGTHKPSTSAGPAKRGPGRPKKKSISTFVKAEVFDTQLAKFPADQQIESGTLVWAKTRLKPWYPAVVFDDDDPEVPVDILSGFNRKEQHIVRLYDSTETWVCVPRPKLKALGKFEEIDQDMMASASHFQGQLTGGWTAEKRDEVLAAYQNATIQVTAESGGEGDAGPAVVQDGDMDVAADSEDEQGKE